MRTQRRNGLKGQQALSPGHRPGCKEVSKFALKGQKQPLSPLSLFLKCQANKFERFI